MGRITRQITAGGVPAACLTLALALAVSACGTMRAGTAGNGQAPASSRPATPSLAQQEQRARTDAAAILASFTPPPGAVRLSRPPGQVGGVLDHAEGYPGVDHLVDDGAWWRVPGTPLGVLGYVKGHLPARFKLGWMSWGAIPPADLPHGRGAPSPPPNPYQRAGYEFDVQSGLPPLESAQLLVDAARSASGQTYIRVDAQLAWTPARSPAERVPAAAKVIVITAQPDMNAPHDIPAPVTVTEPAKVAKIIALLDGLTIDSSGTHGCPALSGRGISLAFLARSGGPALATAAETIPGCYGVSLTIGGRKQPRLADYKSFAQQALDIAGVKWRGWNLCSEPQRLNARGASYQPGTREEQSGVNISPGAESFSRHEQSLQRPAAKRNRGPRRVPVLRAGRLRNGSVAARGAHGYHEGGIVAGQRDDPAAASHGGRGGHPGGVRAAVRFGPARQRATHWRRRAA